MIVVSGTITHECALSTVTPATTVNLIDRVQDVADTYLLTLQVRKQGCLVGIER